MLTSPNPEQTFVEFLFERLLFERVLARNQPSGCCIDPAAMADKFDYLRHYYSELGIRNIDERRGDAIHNLALHDISGIVIHMTNIRGRYKTFPAALAAGFEFGQEYNDDYGEHIHCRFMSNKEIKDFRRDSTTKVPKEYQEEIELLVRILKVNGLMRVEYCGVRAGGLGSLLCDSDSDEEDKSLPPEVRYIAKLEKARLAPELRLRKEQNLVTSIKSLTSMDAIVLSSSAKGVNISDFDIELLLTKPSLRSTSAPDSSSSAWNATQSHTSTLDTMTMNELCNLLKKSGYKSVELSYRYFDTSCEINVAYTTFYDPRSDLTCQITLNHPLGVPLRDLIQAYADYDGRLERLVYGLQQLLSEHGRCKRFLSNYAVALMAIAFMQRWNILPKLQHHREDLAATPSLGQTQKAGQAVQQQQPSGPGSSVAPEASKTTAQSQHGAGRNQRGPRSPPPKPLKSISREVSKNQKRVNARQNRHRRNLHKAKTNSANTEKSFRINDTKNPANTLAAAIAADTIQVPTLSGTTRAIDCHFDRAMAGGDKAFGKAIRSTVGELLFNFLCYFRYGHHFTAEHEVCIVKGNVDCCFNARPDSTWTATGSFDSTKPATTSIAASTSNSNVAADILSPVPTQTPHTPPVSLPKQKNSSQCCFMVRDPLVTDRNVTRLCTGWKQAATLACIVRANESLICADFEEVELSEDDYSFYDDDSDYDDNDEDLYSSSYDSDADQEISDESESEEDDDEAGRGRGVGLAGSPKSAHIARSGADKHRKGERLRHQRLQHTQRQARLWRPAPHASALVLSDGLKTLVLSNVAGQAHRA